MPLIDCDVHIRWSHTDEFAPFLKEPYRSRLSRHILTAQNGYTNSVMDFLKADSKPPSGGRPGSDPQFTVTDLIERYDMDYAVLVGESGHLTVSNFADAGWGSALASAYNDWIMDRWFSADDRFVGSIIIAGQDPVAAAREIERVAEHKQFVQVVLGSGLLFPLGKSFYNPIFEAAHRHNLPIALHPFNEGAGTSPSPWASGYPSFYIEYRTAMPSSLQAHMISVICEGVFERYPGLKLVLVEGGVSWLPALLWRFDREWKGLRAEVPWVKQLPSKYAEESIRLTTQPIEEPADPKHLLQILDMFPAEKMLMFSSDYPHWDFDAPNHVLGKLDKDRRHRIFYENARELYNL